MVIHWFDLFVLFFLLISGGWSYFHGFARELFSILSIAIGYFVASTYYLDAANALGDITPGKTAAEIVGFVSLFVLAVATIVVAGIFFRRLLHNSETLTAVDKITGFGLGIVKGGLILAIIAYPLALIPGVKKDFAAGSVSVPILIGISGALFERLAPGMAENLKEVGANAPQTAEEATRSMKKISEKLGSVGSQLGGVTGKIADTLVDMTSAVMDKSGAKGEEEKPRGADPEEMDRLIESVDE